MQVAAGSTAMTAVFNRLPCFQDTGITGLFLFCPCSKNPRLCASSGKAVMAADMPAAVAFLLFLSLGARPPWASVALVVVIVVVAWVPLQKTRG